MTEWSFAVRYLKKFDIKLNFRGVIFSYFFMIWEEIKSLSESFLKKFRQPAS